MDFDPTTKLSQLLPTTIGPVRLTSILGHGSFAIVYTGQSLRTGAKYAVKTLFKANLSPSQLIIQRQEAELHSRVSHHPHVVTLHTVYEDDECVYLVLDYYPDGDLFDALVGGNDSLSSALADPRTCLQLFLGIVDAVEYCHSRGVYHRDLKPENIMLRERADGTGYEFGLADFGLATDDAFSKDFACGSQRYMSPECFNKDSQHTSYETSANDVWALAIILINLLTQKNPWCEPSSSDPMFEEFSTSGNAEMLVSQFRFSKHLVQLLKRCFEVEFRKRASVRDVHVAIQCILDDHLDILLPENDDDVVDDDDAQRVPSSIFDDDDDGFNDDNGDGNVKFSDYDDDSEPIFFDMELSTPVKKQPVAAVVDHTTDAAIESATRLVSQLEIAPLAESSATTAAAYKPFFGSATTVATNVPSSTTTTSRTSEKKKRRRNRTGKKRRSNAVVGPQDPALGFSSSKRQATSSSVVQPTLEDNKHHDAHQQQVIQKSAHENILSTLAWWVGRIMTTSTTIESDGTESSSSVKRDDASVSSQQRGFAFIVITH